MTLLRISAVFLLCGCQGSVDRTEPATQDTRKAGTGMDGMPRGWWRVESTQPADPGLIGSSFRFHESGYDIVLKNGQADSRVASWSKQGQAWKATGTLSFSLEKNDTGWTLRLEDKTARLTMVDPERAAELNRSVSRSKAPSEICARAEACCKAAMPLLGAECDVAFQLGDKKSARTCELSIKGMRELLKAKAIEIPEICDTH